MRLKSAIWVAAYIRRCDVSLVPAVILRRGAESAGAIFIKVNLLDGTARLFSPAPQALFDNDDLSRRWLSVGNGEPESEEKVDQRLAREFEFDPDIWVIETEDRQGRDFLGDHLIPD